MNELVEKLRELSQEEAPVYMSNEAESGWNSAMGTLVELLDKHEKETA